MVPAVVIKEFENYFAQMIPLIDLIAAESYIAEEKTGTYILTLVKLSENIICLLPQTLHLSEAV